MTASKDPKNTKEALAKRGLASGLCRKELGIGEVRECLSPFC